MRRVVIVCVVAGLSAVAAGNAQSLRPWTAPGGGSWSNNTNWSGGILPSTSGDAAVFTNTSPIIVTLDNASGYTVGGLAAGAQNLVLNSGAGGGLTLSGATPWITNAGSLTINVPFTSTNFTKYGAGTLHLTNDNSSTLADAMITVVAGQLRGYSGTSATGREFGAATTTVQIQTNAQIRFFAVNGGERNFTQVLRLKGSGPAGGNPGALNNDSGASAAANIHWSGPILLEGDTTIGAQNNGSFTLNTITGTNRTLTLNLNAATTAITGAVHVASLVKSGSGNVTFSGTGSLTAAALNLQGGVFRFTSGTGLQDVTNLSLIGGATLDLATSETPVLELAAGHALLAPGGLPTTVRGSVVVGPGATFGPGSGVANYGTLAVTNELAVTGGTLRFDLNVTAAATSDRVTAAQLSLASPASVEFAFPSGAPQLGVPYTLFTYSGMLNGTATKLSSPGDGAGYAATFSDATPGAITVTFSAGPSNLVINFASGVHTYSSLNNSIVTLDGPSELRLTAASSPLPGSVVHLNSPDAFLVLPNMLPSAVVTSVLGQVRVNGAAAVADSTVRVVQYAMGAVVVPHAPSFQPLTVFSGPHFTGGAMPLGQYSYYRGADLGEFNAAISSFRLKRGYQAIIAQNEDGTGLSQCYVAQDGDLEVSLLPASLDDSVRFVHVVPWRWTSKKGIAGNIESGLNLRWKYNWNISQNSTRDLEYVPIRQTQWWPSLAQDWQARGASHLLGFNEPDRPDQANMGVATAIANWPGLLATGLRVGAPAVSDGGLDWWLYPFMSQADSGNLRVDFVPVHYYRCFNPSDPNGAADQMYNFLKAAYDTVKRPLWITEWNNGANWTGCGDPTFAQQQAAVAAMIQMLDDTPFVERYALYNWVEDVRRLKWDDGSLTSAGVTYRDQPSPIGHVQQMPGNGRRSFAQLRFETNTLDTSGYGNNGVPGGSPAFTNGMSGSALRFDGSNTVVTLPSTVARNSAFTFAAWVWWDGGPNWQRLFDFGNSTTHFLYLTPRSSGGKLRFSMKNGGSEQVVETAALASNQWRHVAVTLSGSLARLYVNGALTASNSSMTISPASFSPRVNRLGQSQFIADPLFKGLMDEVLITDYALSGAQIAALQTNTPPQFTHRSLVVAPAIEAQSYSNSIAGTATDANPGDPLSYSKISGPTWLSIAANGTLTGMPGSSDLGTNLFTVRVTDAAGMNDFAMLAVAVQSQPPVLPVQDDRTVVELTLLRVTNAATLGLPPLSYSLLNPPSGAAIDSAGVITWTPSEAQGPGGYVLTTVVTDSAEPPTRATNNFTVTVLETNHPPTLVSPGNQTRNVGQWVNVINVATDPDPEPTVLTFTLLAAPNGAGINATNGVVTWRPPVARAGTLNWFTVRCADDGVPSLSATQSFAVLVNALAPVSLTAGTVTGTQFSLGFTGEAGPDYTLQTATNLAGASAWTEVLTTNLTSSPLWLQQTLPPDESAQRFYRIRVGP